MEDNETKNYIDMVKGDEPQQPVMMDLPQKDGESISIKYEPKFFDNFHMYFSKYFLLSVLPSTAFTFLAMIGLMFMFVNGLTINKNAVWVIVGVLFGYFVILKPLFEFVMIKIKSKEKCSCEFFGDKEKVILRTPVNEKMYKYDFLKRIVETEHGMTFKFGQIRHLYIPARIYKNNPDFEKYYKMLEKNYMV